jgi:hypothetical protein
MRSDQDSGRVPAEALGKGAPGTRCPQLRPARTIYPVDGYCVFDQSVGWFMIPSVDEFRTYCTTPRFSQCLWLRRAQGPRDSRGSAPERPALPDSWEPPDAW